MCTVASKSYRSIDATAYGFRAQDRPGSQSLQLVSAFALQAFGVEYCKPADKARSKKSRI